MSVWKVGSFRLSLNINYSIKKDSMKKQILAAWLFAVAIVGAPAQSTTAWGDQGNGTYVNPILNADYSDPDVIRVGEKYYMVCSD